MKVLRKILGVLLLIVGAIPALVFMLFVVPWGILECGPVDSSCHHFPYRPLIFLAVCLVILIAGGLLLSAAQMEKKFNLSGSS